MNYYIKFTFILTLLISCEKSQTYTCVCYNKKNPENYNKYPIKNTYNDSQYYCESMSNSQQSCNITK